MKHDPKRGAFDLLPEGERLGSPAEGLSTAEAELADALGLSPGDIPFPWQVRLLDSFLHGELPRSLDIPTGLGKTSTIAIWLVARALGAAVPRRLVYVVDRRAVVDQATDEAVRLRAWVKARPEVARRLGVNDRRLAISTLRGQYVDNREWLEDPAAPAIIVGTVDMVGSRLLFGGYGTSRKMRPLHAALLGNDSLFVLDEAHLVPPFERLLERIASAAPDLHPAVAAKLPVGRPIRLLSLSATGRSQGGDAFRLADADLEHPEVRRRLRGPKHLTLEALPEKADLPTALAAHAWALAEHGARPTRCIVFTHRREHAEKALLALRKLAGIGEAKKGKEPVADVELFVGARRVREREVAADRLRTLGFLAGSEVPRSRPAFLFATSAGEVGVDLDADDMVCDLVAWERMVQRLGRVNRRGRGSARVIVLAEALEKPTPEEQGRREALLTLLARLPPTPADARDASLVALRDLRRAAETDGALAESLERAQTPPPMHPPLSRQAVDAWSMTSLAEHPGRPAVSPWLRGWVESPPQATLVWRTFLPVPETRRPIAADVERFFEAAPVHTSEKLELETYRAADWLMKRARRLLQKPERSAAGVDARLRTEDIVAFVLPETGARAQHWQLGRIASASKSELERALSHAIWVLDARIGGLVEGLLEDAEDASPPTADGPDWLPEADGVPTVGFRVRKTTDPVAIEDADWRERSRVAVARDADGQASQWLMVEKWRYEVATEEDRAASRPQELDEHQEWAASRARELAARLALPPEAEHTLVTAARLHDEGKRAARWQMAFHAPTAEIYAKTRGPVNVHLLDGYRHEFGSLSFAERDPVVCAMPDEQRDLVLHLIASHHGFARPVISARGCEDAPPSVLRARERQVALRFARLQEKWGPWGLAWWEALLRAADQQASRDNDALDRKSRIGSEEN